MGSCGLAVLLTWSLHVTTLSTFPIPVIAILPLQIKKLRQRDTTRATPGKWRVEVKLLVDWTDCRSMHGIFLHLARTLPASLQAPGPCVVPSSQNSLLLSSSPDKS